MRQISILFRKRNVRVIRYLFLLGIGVFIPAASHAHIQENSLLQDKAVKVYLDVKQKNETYIKDEIPFVNYVRDRKLAQVYIMMTDQETGAGGKEYTIKLIGQTNFEGVNDTLKYVSKQMDTEEMIRSEMVKILKKGLIRYVEKTPLSEYITVSYKSITKPTDVIDKWDNWVFNTQLKTDVGGEKRKKDAEFEGSFYADRVTPDLKVSLGISGHYERNKFQTTEGWYTSISRSKNFQGLIVKSLSQHCSAGLYGSVNASTFSNTKFYAEIAPAVELDVFPYSDYTHREFRFLYKMAYNNIQYEEETIYEKMREPLFYESLSATFELKERWGSLQSTLVGSHYLHDFNKNRAQFNTNINLRLFEGFSLDIKGSVSRIHDQLSLAREDATDEEILLHRKQIATSYNYKLEMGFRFTFGSIYSNVVNPRFGIVQYED